MTSIHFVGGFTMHSRCLWLRVICSAVAAALLAACAQHGGALLPPAAPGFTLDLVPPNCKGQVTTKQYATLTVKLSTNGGTLCVPAFGGFGGSIKYPGANPSVKLKLTSSTKNYNHQPQLGNGTAIFYLQLGLSGGTSFSNNVRAGGGLTAKQIVPGKDYTAYGQVTISGFPLNFGPCWVTATKGKYGGVIGGVGTLLKGVTIPAAVNGVIEIYSGDQGGPLC
jgi:hypothetical protein